MMEAPQGHPPIQEHPLGTHNPGMGFLGGKSPPQPVQETGLVQPTGWRHFSSKPSHESHPEGLIFSLQRPFLSSTSHLHNQSPNLTSS